MDRSIFFFCYANFFFFYFDILVSFIQLKECFTEKRKKKKIHFTSAKQRNLMEIMRNGLYTKYLNVLSISFEIYIFRKIVLFYYYSECEMS